MAIYNKGSQDNNSTEIKIDYRSFSDSGWGGHGSWGGLGTIIEQITAENKAKNS